MSVMDWLKQNDSQDAPEATVNPKQIRYKPWSRGKVVRPEPQPLPLNEAIAAGFPDLDPQAVAQPMTAPIQIAAGVSLEELEGRVIGALRSIFDPEIPVNIYDLGLIYGLNIDPEKGHVDVQMTLTAPGCPVAQTFPGEVERRMTEVPGIDTAKVELVWDPPWTRERMSEAALLNMGLL